MKESLFYNNNTIEASLLLLDFDRTIINGQLHNFLRMVYNNIAIGEICAEARELNDSQFCELLRNAAIFTHLAATYNFTDANSQIAQEILSIFRGGNVIEELKSKLNCDFSSFQAFPDEEGLKAIIKDRLFKQNPTAIVTNSAFAEIIKDVMVLLGDSSNKIPVYSAEAAAGKKGLIEAAVANSGVTAGTIVFMDDDKNNITTAQGMFFSEDLWMNAILVTHTDQIPVYVEPEQFQPQPPTPYTDLDQAISRTPSPVVAITAASTTVLATDMALDSRNNNNDDDDNPAVPGAETMALDVVSPLIQTLELAAVEISADVMSRAMSSLGGMDSLQGRERLISSF